MARSSASVAAALSEARGLSQECGTLPKDALPARNAGALQEWVNDSGSGNHLVGYDSLSEAQKASITLPERLATANSIIEVNRTVRLFVQVLQCFVHVLVLDDSERLVAWQAGA